jgi:hypothetical protein
MASTRSRVTYLNRQSETVRRLQPVAHRLPQCTKHAALLDATMHLPSRMQQFTSSISNCREASHRLAAPYMESDTVMSYLRHRKAVQHQTCAPWMQASLAVAAVPLCSVQRVMPSKYWPVAACWREKILTLRLIWRWCRLRPPRGRTSVPPPARRQSPPGSRTWWQQKLPL